MKMPTLEQFRKNRNVLFWSLHAAFWAAYGITQYVGDIFYAYGSSSSWGLLLLIVAGAGFVLSAPMRYIYRQLWGRQPRTIVVGVLLTCYITALALRIVPVVPASAPRSPITDRPAGSSDVPSPTAPSRATRCALSVHKLN